MLYNAVEDVTIYQTGTNTLPKLFGISVLWFLCPDMCIYVNKHTDDKL